MDAFSSKDLVNWTKHERIIDTAAIKWARRAMWAPAIVHKDGKYFLFFAANDIQNEQQAKQTATTALPALTKWSLMKRSLLNR